MTESKKGLIYIEEIQKFIRELPHKKRTKPRRFQNREFHQTFTVPIAPIRNYFRE